MANSKSFLASVGATALVLSVGSGCATRPAEHDVEAPTPCAVTASPTILFVLSAAGEQTLRNGKTRATGFFLSEFYEAYRAVVDAGYDVAIATTDGRAPVVDPESLEGDYWEAHPTWKDEALALVSDDPRFATPLSLPDVRQRSNEYIGLVVPGGQGVMIDLVDDADLHALVVEYGASGRAVGLICHAPALLTRIPDRTNPFAGRTVTSVSGFEEFYIERFVMKGRALDRKIARQLGAKGYRHRRSFPGKPGAQRDGNLVTSQNPFSGDAFNTELLAVLAEQSDRRGC